MGLLNAGMLGALGAQGGGGLESGMLGLLPMLMQQQGGQRPQMSQTPPIAPQGGQMGGGLAGAFQNNPQFQQQLQAMLSQQSPGFQGAQMTPPQSPVSMQQGGMGGQGGGMAPGGAMGAGGLGTNLGAMERWRAMQMMNVR